MKFALVNNIRTEASKGIQGVCPICGSDLIAHCGEVKVHHWVHKNTRNCDLWWENETEWHRSWKNNFPVKWQEVVHFDKHGEKHIADVKTDEQWALEFQHSYLQPEERRSRNAFYSKIVWIVDGMRRTTDIAQFQKVIHSGSAINYHGVPIIRINSPEDSRLLKEWGNSNVPVFFDFQESNDLKTSRLWFYLPTNSNSLAYFMPYSILNFIELHNNRGFDELVNVLIPGIRNFLYKHEQTKSQIRIPQPRIKRRQRRF